MDIKIKVSWNMYELHIYDKIIVLTDYILILNVCAEEMLSPMLVPTFNLTNLLFSITGCH